MLPLALDHFHVSTHGMAYEHIKEKLAKQNTKSKEIWLGISTHGY